MKIINKIGILICWPREIDMYSKFLQHKSSKFEFIVNDNFSFERGRNISNKKILEIMNKKKLQYKLYSKVFNKVRYKILISTGEFSGYHINLYSVVRYIYGKTVGNLLHFFKISNFLERVFGRPFTAGGNDVKLGIVWYPEKKLAQTIIKFPDGIDIKKKNYPYDIYKKVFDIYFSYCDFEIELIKNKFKNKLIKKIDYFRFLNEKKNDKNYLSELKFDLDLNKKTILWAPTHIEYFKEEDNNILHWLKKLKCLNKYFNIIIRPHPKTISRNKNIINDIRNLNFHLDDNFDQNIMSIMSQADLIFADYGGIIFDAIFLKKKLILLNLDKNSIFSKELSENHSMDIIARQSLENFDLTINEDEILKKTRDLMNTNDDNYTTKIKLKYYGQSGACSFKDTINFLEGLL